MKMKWNKKLLSLSAAAFLFDAAITPALATGLIETITVRSGISLNVNGENVVPTDASGKQMPVFLYDATTYVPVRYLSEQYGKEVDWDPETATVYINDPTTLNPDLSDPGEDEAKKQKTEPATSLIEFWKESHIPERNEVYLWQNAMNRANENLGQVIAFVNENASITFRMPSLNKYSKMKFTMGLLQNGAASDITLKVHAIKERDEEDSYDKNINLYANQASKNVELNLKNVRSITLTLSTTDNSDRAALTILALYNAALS